MEERQLTNRFLGISIQQLQISINTGINIRAQLDEKEYGQVSYNRIKQITNPIELKLKTIKNNTINQNLTIYIINEENGDNDNDDITNSIIGQYSISLNNITSSLINLNTYGNFSIPISFLLPANNNNNNNQIIATAILNLWINNRNFDFEIEQNNKNVVLLPKHDPTFNFIWRLRVDIRQAIDLPANSSTYIECNWTMADNSNYDGQNKEQFNEVYRTGIKENETNPIYNTYGQPAFTNVQGYLAFKIKNSTTHITFDEVYFPISSFKPFIPFNIELQSTKKEFKVKPKYFLSMCLEQQPQDGKGLCDIIIHNFNLSSPPSTDTSLQIMITNQSFTPKQVQYSPIEIQGGAKLQKGLEKLVKLKEWMSIGCINSVVESVQADQFYGAIAVFTLPISLLSSQIQLFAISKDPKIKQTHSLTNSIIGSSQTTVDNILLSLHASESIESQKINVKWNKNSKLFDVFNKLNGEFDIGVFSQKDAKNIMPKEQTPVPSEPSLHESQQQLSQQQQSINEMSQKSFSQADLNESRNNLENKSQRSINSQLNKQINPTDRSFKDSDLSESNLAEDTIWQNDIQKWSVLSKELAQKQEIIHRMNKDIEDKTDSLKTTGEEITDLRKKIKVLKNENGLLMKRLNSEQEIELKTKTTPEIRNMKPELLQQNIIKVATAYRDERLKNEEFDKQIKEAYGQIIKAKHQSEELEHLMKVRLQGAHKLTDLKEVIAKVPLYRETIDKQQKIILKLEQAMETTLKGSEHIKQMEKQFNSLKNECETLQDNLRNRVFNNQTSELARVKRESEKLQAINQELLQQLSTKQRPTSAQNIDLYTEQIELEAQLFNVQSRVEAMQEELSRNAQDHSKELSQLRTEIAKKQAILNTMDGQFY